MGEPQPHSTPDPSPAASEPTPYGSYRERQIEVTAAAAGVAMFVTPEVLETLRRSRDWRITALSSELDRLARRVADLREAIGGI